MHRSPPWSASRSRACFCSAPGLLLSLFALGACSKGDSGKPAPSPRGEPSPVVSMAPVVRPPSPEVAKELNVLLISIDSLRADMPWAGYPRPIAPRLTEFEGKSVSYTRAYAISSYTSMSVGGLLAGRYPHELKRDGFFFGRYAAQNLMFPEVLKGAGVFTAAAHAHGYFGWAGFDQGFDRWEIVPNLKWNPQADDNVTSPQLEGLAEKLLTEAGGKGRFFAWFHFMDPHDDYLPHDADGIPPFGGKLRDKYDAEVLFTDRWVGKLLDFVASMPWAKQTAIVITSDHGEAFGEHTQYRHGFEIWENLVRIPLMVQLPGGAARRVDEPRSAIDLAPTILELLGVPPEPSFVGKSLVPELRGGPVEPRDVLVDLPATSNNDRRRALVSGKKKIYAYGKSELYHKLFDLEADPGEEHPIMKGEDLDAMRAKYKERSALLRDVMPTQCGDGCLEGTPKEDAGARPR